MTVVCSLKTLAVALTHLVAQFCESFFYFSYSSAIYWFSFFFFSRQLLRRLFILMATTDLANDCFVIILYFFPFHITITTVRIRKTVALLCPAMFKDASACRVSQLPYSTTFQRSYFFVTGLGGFVDSARPAARSLPCS